MTSIRSTYRRWPRLNGWPRLFGPLVAAAALGCGDGRDAGISTDGGTHALVDAARDASEAPRRDAGVGQTDGGATTTDAGARRVDASFRPEDAATTADAGDVRVDAEAPIADAGAPIADAGSPISDAGTLLVDAAIVRDGGTEPPARGCRIDSATFVEGDYDPSGACRLCLPESSRTAWTPCPTDSVWKRGWATPRDRFAMTRVGEGGVVVFPGIGMDIGRAGLETLRFDGVRFVDESVAAAPLLSYVYSFAAAYDVDRDRVVIFGGVSTTGPAPTRTVERRRGGAYAEVTSAAAGPGARHEHAMAYDEMRHVVVLFGGQSTSGTRLQDTWTYDGTHWTRQAPDDAPTPRVGHAMAYDPSRGAVVLYGGTDTVSVFSDTWEWNGMTWVRGTDGAPRAFHAMTYDAGERALVSVGGTTMYGTSGVSEVRTRDSSGTWHTRAGASPTARISAEIAYDPVTHASYLFGGEGPGAAGYPTGELWTLSDGAFALYGDVPSPRFGHAMAYDPERGRTVLFGGVSGSGSRLRDTWEWDGRRWQQVSSTGPSARMSAAMAFDPRSHRVVLHGGQDTISGAVADTWRWDGTTWMQVSETSSIGTRFEHAMAYDPNRSAVVLFGGQFGATNPAGFWQLASDGSWTSLGGGVLGRAGLSMTTDATRSRMLLCGGFPANGLVAIGDGGTIATLSATGGVCDGRTDRITFVSRRHDVVAVSDSGNVSAVRGVSTVWTDLPAIPNACTYRAIAADPYGAVLFGGLLAPGVTGSFQDTWVYGR